jgi:cyclic lactone autoinducer peptide
MLKLAALKLIGKAASLVATADVSTNSYILFYQPEIPAKLKK